MIMKKVVISVFAFAVLASCSKEENKLNGGDPAAPVAIAPSAGIVTNLITRAAVDGTTFSAGTDVFRLCAFETDGAEPTDWTVDDTTPEAFENVQVDMGSTDLSLKPTAKYYPPAGPKKLWFYAYAPFANGTYNAGNGATAPTVDYTITGDEDIMTGKVTNDNGIGAATYGTTQKQPEFVFSHLLKKITFKVAAGDAFASGVYVKTIMVKNVNTRVTLDVTKGGLKNWNTIGELTLSNLNTEIIQGGSPVDGCLMFEPGTEFTVSVTTGDGITYADAKVKLTGTDAGNAGMHHVVTLTFHKSSIIPSATIVDWVDGDDAGVNLQ